MSLMETKLFRVDPEHCDEFDFTEPADCIKAGRLVAFPTETVYGLGANALDAKACDSIFKAKGRPHDNPLIVHVLRPEDCEQYAHSENCPLFFKLAGRFMPGPLTVILPKKNIIPDSVTVGLDTVALRCPSHPVARELIRSAGVPIAAPSANLSGKPSPTTAQHVIDDMLGKIDMIIDGGDCKVGLESTVIAIKEDAIHLLRPGFVTVEDLSEICPNIFVSPAVLSALSASEQPESPGMKYRHYAPDVSVTMVDGQEEKVLAFFREKLEQGCGVLCFDEDLLELKTNSENAISFGSKNDLLSQANALFDALRKFNHKNVSHIYARHTARQELGLAISNRLLRACAFDEITL